MKTVEKVLTLAETLVEQKASYDKRNTKAESARMRSTMTEMKKIITEAKRELLAADKGA